VFTLRNAANMKENKEPKTLKGLRGSRTYVQKRFGHYSKVPV
jgi:hypothetical protein